VAKRNSTLENLVIEKNFWKGRSVFVTGHTGFKGGWLALWLNEMGAKVYGYSLSPKSKKDFFKITNLGKKIYKSFISCDIRNTKNLKNKIKYAKPSIIFHLAAQSIVRKSYLDPLNTFSTNIIGTANVFEAAKNIDSVKVIINVTSDKCYENYENKKPFEENSPLGGRDPYSGSKACAEIITKVYEKSFFTNNKIKLASVRAGNVIGGGDWSAGRLIPDIFKASLNKKKILLRCPKSRRPWQHVLEALNGYILLAEKLSESNKFIGAWNFGPEKKDEKTVSWIANYLCKKTKGKWKIDKRSKPYEANILKLNSQKSRIKLKWKTKLDIQKALDMTYDWYQAFTRGENMYNVSKLQIISYLSK